MLLNCFACSKEKNEDEELVVIGRKITLKPEDHYSISKRIEPSSNHKSINADNKSSHQKIKSEKTIPEEKSHTSRHSKKFPSGFIQKKSSTEVLVDDFLALKGPKSIIKKEPTVYALNKKSSTPKSKSRSGDLSVEHNQETPVKEAKTEEKVTKNVQFLSANIHPMQNTSLTNTKKEKVNVVPKKTQVSSVQTLFFNENNFESDKSEDSLVYKMLLDPQNAIDERRDYLRLTSQIKDCNFLRKSTKTLQNSLDPALLKWKIIIKHHENNRR